MFNLRLLVLALVLGFSSSSAFAGGFDTTGSDLPFNIKGVSVGDWTSEQLAITGGLSATAPIVVGNTTSTCGSANAGAIKFDLSSQVFLGCNGSNWVSLSAQQGTNLAVFTTVGTTSWTAPSGVTKVEIEVWGGGGGANWPNGGTGGGGGYSIGTYNVTPGSTYTITVGGGGAAAEYPNSGGDGGTSLFASTTATLIEATGGLGGTGGGGAGGVGYGGKLNISGGYGMDLGGNDSYGVTNTTYAGVQGGAAPRGGPGGGVLGSGSPSGGSMDGQQPGGGGGGSSIDSGSGAAGAVMIRY